MNKLIPTAMSAFLIGAISTGVIVAQAQNAAPPADGPARHDRGWGNGLGGHGGPGGHDGWRMGEARGGWGEHMRDHMREHGGHQMEMMRAFALVAHAEDRKLTPADVTKIGEAFLLWNGNHTWKVVNAAAEGDAIGFDFATKEGSVIAHFTMDPKNGHLKRVS